MTLASGIQKVFFLAAVGAGVLGCPSKPPLPGGPPPEYEPPRPFPEAAGADDKAVGGDKFDDLPAAPTEPTETPPSVAPGAGVTDPSAADAGVAPTSPPSPGGSASSDAKASPPPVGPGDGPSP